MYGVRVSGVKIGSNIGSLTAQRYLDTASARLSNAFERLSSGMRINRASDDAAGLAISSSLNASVRVGAQAVRNLSDGISLANIAEGALSQLKEITYRQRELATQAANGSYTLVQRQAMNAEANKLVEEYNRIVASTTFNGTKLFGDDPQGVRIQAGQGVDGSLLLGLGDGLSRNVGDGTFGSAQGYSLPERPAAVATCDMNGDGHLDLLAATPGQKEVYIALGTGDGDFVALNNFSTGIESSSLAIEDLNGDGAMDVVAVGNGFVRTLLGNGSGSWFNLGPVFAAGGGASSVEVNDVNGDGRTDIITADSTDSTVSVFLGNGDGTFQARMAYSSGLAPNSVTAGDFNGDGLTDIATSDYSSCTVSVLLGNGDGSFQARREFDAGISPYSVRVGDVNGDGCSDLVAAAGGDDTITVLLGNGDGTFQAKRSFDTGVGPSAAAIGDFDGDGRSDIVTADFSGDAVSILLGNGDGTFRPRQAFGVGDGPCSVAIGDFNGDGRPDLVTADSDDDSLGILLAEGPRTSATSYLNINTRQGALDAMSVIDGNLQRIQNELGSIGATTSRFSVALATLQATRENEAAAVSRITDADIAQETAEMTKAQILRQVAASVLGQANQAPQLALLLLK